MNLLLVQIKNITMLHSWFILSVDYFSECVMLCGCWWFWTCWWNIWNGRFSLHSTVIKVFCWFWGEQFEEKAQSGTSVPTQTLFGTFDLAVGSLPDHQWPWSKLVYWFIKTPYEPTSSPETLAGRPLWLFPSPDRRLGVNGLWEQTWNQIRCNLLLFFCVFYFKCWLKFFLSKKQFPLHRFHGWTEHE